MAKDKENKNDKKKEEKTLNELVEHKGTGVVSGFENEGSFDFMQRVSTMLAKSTLVPKAYQGNVANCAIALNMASRMKADPLMVMQNLYTIHGSPSWSSQFLIAAFNTQKPDHLSGIKYKWVGEKGTDSWGCKAFVKDKEEDDVIEGATITIKLSKEEGWYSKSGSKWKTMPEQMLMYRASAWFIRAYYPEIAMGLHTVDEIIDVEGAVIEGEDSVKDTIDGETASEELEFDDERVKEEDTEQEDGEGDIDITVERKL